MMTGYEFIMRNNMEQNQKAKEAIFHSSLHDSSQGSVSSRKASKQASASFQFNWTSILYPFERIANNKIMNYVEETALYGGDESTVALAAAIEHHHHEHDPDEESPSALAGAVINDIEGSIAIGIEVDVDVGIDPESESGNERNLIAMKNSALSSQAIAPSTETSALEEIVKTQKENAIRDANESFSLLLRKIKRTAEAMSSELSTYLDVAEGVEVDYIRCQNSSRNEAKRLREVEPDIDGTTNILKFEGVFE